MQVIYDGSSSTRADVLTFTQWEGIKKGLDYKFYLQAFNPVGQSDLSEPLTVLAAVVPSAPLNLNVTGSDAGSIALEWTAPLDNGGAILTGYYAYF